MKKMIAFESYPDYSNNSKIMYEYFLKEYPDKYNYIWIVYDEKNKDFFESSNIKYISPEDNDFEEKFCEVDLILSTHNFAARYKKEYQILFSLWHGGGFKKQGYFNELDKNNLAINQKIDYFVTSSEFMSTVFSATLDLSIKKFLPFGNPRSDILFTTNAIKNLQKTSDIDFSIYSKILIYLPTFRKSSDREEGYININNILNFENYDEKKLTNFLEKNDYLLITKYHPAEEAKHVLSHDKNILNLTDEDLKSNDLTLDEILGACDLVISDYSSSYFEFLKMKKPVVFCHYDFEEYSSKRGILFEDYELWFPGPRVNHIDTFISETDKLLNNNDYYLEQRERTNRVINGDYQSSSRELIANFVTKRLLNDQSKEIEKLNIQNQKYKKRILILEHEVNKVEELKTLLSSYERRKLYKISKKIYSIKDSKGGGNNG